MDIRLAYLLTLTMLLFLFTACTSEKQRLYGNCIHCHNANLDKAHTMSCTVCHDGNTHTKNKNQAHQGLVAAPAHPQEMALRCGSCHGEQVASLQKSSHYTLQNEVNQVRQHFGSTQTLDSLMAIPQPEEIGSLQDLADDMLRRRCLRCHLFSQGDNYVATQHGTGCAACHLSYSNGTLQSHNFQRYPADQNCLSCHYGNYVGADYYGHFEHDLNHEYRTPYRKDNVRPYGVEYHQLTPDIHQIRGMVCIDCHTGKRLMGQDNTRISCAACHDATFLEQETPPGISGEKENYTFTSAATGTEHPLPLLRHPAHAGTQGKIHCQVCHAQWSYNDGSQHLLRSDIDEYDQWDKLRVQGSSEIEQLLEHNLNYDNEELPPATSGEMNKKNSPGIWYKGYLVRRWEGVLVGRNAQGMLTVVRPILDLHLSWLDENEEIIYNSVSVQDSKSPLRPYVPHTTGSAGLFYEQRIRDFLALPQKTSTPRNKALK